MRLTRHAIRRSQQRGIPSDILSTIYAFGSAKHAEGALSLTLDKTAIELASEDDRTTQKRLESYRGCYVILGDGETGVTVARRRRRFRSL